MVMELPQSLESDGQPPAGILAPKPPSAPRGSHCRGRPADARCARAPPSEPTSPAAPTAPTPPSQPRPKGSDPRSFTRHRHLSTGAEEPPAQQLASSPSFTDMDCWVGLQGNAITATKEKTEKVSQREKRSLRPSEWAAAIPNLRAAADKIHERDQPRRSRSTSTTARGSSGMRGTWLAVCKRMASMREVLNAKPRDTVEGIMNAVNDEIIEDAIGSANRQRAQSSSPSTRARSLRA